MPVNKWIEKTNHKPVKTVEQKAKPKEKISPVIKRATMTRTLRGIRK